MPLPLILASASPRRQDLLRAIGLPFEVFAVDVDESAVGSPEEVVRLLARREARAAAALKPGRLILAADTLVWAKGETLGKPRDQQDALRMLGLLSGGRHSVFTGLCLMQADGREQCEVVETAVYFDPLNEQEMLRYIATGEPLDKAGAYAVQGRAGQYVHRIEGSYSNVVGLPLHSLRRMLLQVSDN